MITGQINCNFEYLLDVENFPDLSFILKSELRPRDLNYNRQSLVDVGSTVIQLYSTSLHHGRELDLGNSDKLVSYVHFASLHEKCQYPLWCSRWQTLFPSNSSCLK